MTLILSGTNGVSDIDGDASTPAIRGTDANSGIFFGADTVGVSTGGSEKVSVGASAVVFNDGGADVDFRVEGDTNANLLFVDAGNDRVGIGTNSPEVRLEVSSGATTFGAKVFSTGTNTYAPTASTSLVAANLQIFSGNGSGACTGMRISQTSDFELFFGGVQESGGAGAFVFQGYSGSAYAERARITSAGDFQMNSGYGSVATAYACRAWVNFDGTTNVGGNCTIRGSGNVSTVADNGTGNYTVNFTTAMPDANYSALVTAGVTGNASGSNPEFYGKASNFLTGSVRANCRNAQGGANDSEVICVSVFR